MRSVVDRNVVMRRMTVPRGSGLREKTKPTRYIGRDLSLKLLECEARSLITRPTYLYGH